MRKLVRENSSGVPGARAPGLRRFCAIWMAVHADFAGAGVIEACV